jgi:hypothetical protein
MATNGIGNLIAPSKVAEDGRSPRRSRGYMDP